MAQLEHDTARVWVSFGFISAEGKAHIGEQVRVRIPSWEQIVATNLSSLSLEKLIGYTIRRGVTSTWMASECFGMESNTEGHESSDKKCFLDHVNGQRGHIGFAVLVYD